MNTVDILVGKRIRARRLAIGMSQAALGSAVGVKFQQVQKYETAYNRVSASRLWAIADALDVEVMQFFGGILPVAGNTHGKKSEPKDNNPRFSDPEVLELTELYNVLPTSHKKAVLEVVRSMAKSKLTDRAG
jgi:transcriptional regulator with XRE-family HTH domain